MTRRWSLATAIVALAVAVPGIPALADQAASGPANPIIDGVPTNPLAAPVQVSAEAEAIRILNSPQVQQAIQGILPQFQQAAGASAERQGLIAQDAQTLAFSEIIPFVPQNADIALNPYHPAFVTVNDNAHQWFGLDVPTGQFAIDNPDVSYRTIAVDPHSSYVIHGRRHAVGPADVSFSLLTTSGSTAVNLAYSALQIASDGTYTVTLDNQPANGRVNHIQTTPTSDVLIVRNNYNDWQNQVADTLSVTRTAGPAAPPILTEDQLATLAAARIAPAAQGLSTYANVPVNTFAQPGAGNPSLTTQLNVLGHFQLTDQQALVFKVNLGGSAYFVAPVYDIFTADVDPIHHTSSLNNDQSVPNADGTITYVLSAHDPGVYNWLDTGGLHEGLLFFRWQRIPNPSPASGPPDLNAQLVNISDLPSVLAASNSTAGGSVTPAQRTQQLADRFSSFQHRYNDLTARLSVSGVAAHRNSNGTVTVTANLNNGGTGDAIFVQIGSARLGNAAATAVSVPATVSAGTSVPVTLTFPSVPAGQATLSLSGSSDTGSFSDGLRIAVP